MKKNKIIVIAGPTGVGKTDLSIQLSKRLNGEIVSCDSMQVYKYMDIGTAKIKEEDKDGIEHYMLDVVLPNQNFDIVEFQKMALESIKKIHEKGKIPILVGGTGFYIQAIINEIEFTNKKDDSYKNKLQQIAKTSDGVEILSTMLKEIDPESYDKIHKNNLKKVIRALEFFHENNYSIQEHNMTESKKQRRFDTYFYVLTFDRQKLYERINLRVDKMFDEGLVDEVKKLIKLGIKESTTASQGIGYKEVLEFLGNELTENECRAKIKKASRNYAKRQLTWFRREENVKFIDKKIYSDVEILEMIINEVRNDVH